ncbi:GNAT family N-acetyltransferase [Acholeplasma granularum]|uniref:GNAT family N-acetyltransferase n=1 Tax=Acholeplasma granularum TaxID=264635 RepID=UPI0004AE2427|nr:GNAT family N-acetyltransferase [Acholeplasma granularum]
MDLLVNLYELKFENQKIIDGIKYLKILPTNFELLIEFIRDNFADTNWASEVKVSLYKTNPTCFIATYNNEIVGFAAYDATAKGFFGPTGVKETFRGKNIGANLLMNTLEAMYFDGYGYAIIGGAGNGKAKAFYQKVCNATVIQSDNSVYDRHIKHTERGNK